MTLFEAAKTVSALDAAERYAGIKAIRKGRRAWAKCPFHKDAKSSLAFDLEGKFSGRFKCSDCNRTGSSIEFVADLFHERPVDAARRICEDYRIEYDNASAETREKAKARKAVEHLSSEIREARAFALRVASGIIKESRDKLSEIDAFDPVYKMDRENLEAIISDASIFKKSVVNAPDADTICGLLAEKGVSEKIAREYRRLKRIDDQTGTEYVSAKELHNTTRTVKESQRGVKV